MARQYELMGLDMVWVPEVYTFDSVSLLGAIAEATERIELGSAILPLYSRTPTLIAMTAAGIDSVSKGRFTLGLGVSGPQVIEGWHGSPYDDPLGRTRETVEFVGRCGGAKFSPPRGRIIRSRCPEERD